MPPTTVVTPVYFDAAIVAKFYVNEPGRAAVRQVAQQAGKVVTSGVAVAEVSAAFHRKLREGAVTPAIHRALQGQFAHDVVSALWTLVGPSEALLQEVQALYGRLDRAVFLRAMDAMHLVTAKAEGFDRIYSNDRHVLAACRTMGLEGVNPIA